MNFIYQFAILLTNQLVASTSLQDIGTGLEILFQLEFAGPYQSLESSPVGSIDISQFRPSGGTRYACNIFQDRD